MIAHVIVGSVTIRDVRAVPILVIRRPLSGAELAAFVPSACGAVWEFLRARGLRGGHNVAFYLDGQTVEAGVEFEGKVVPAGDVLKSALPSGRAAYAMHVGPFRGLGLAHRAVREWCGLTGHALAGPSWEVYGHWRDDWNTDPSKIETEVYWLLR